MQFVYKTQFAGNIRRILSMLQFKVIKQQCKKPPQISLRNVTFDTCKYAGVPEWNLKQTIQIHTLSQHGKPLYIYLSHIHSNIKTWYVMCQLCTLIDILK